jgi:two-component system sensor histidine kinase MprB
MRLTLAAATAVAVAVLLAAGYSYVSVRDQLQRQVDERLHDQAERISDSRFFGRVLGPVPSSPLASEQPVVQLVGADGTTTRPTNQRGHIPVDATDRAVAAGKVEQHFFDATVRG